MKKNLNIIICFLIAFSSFANGDNPSKSDIVIQFYEGNLEDAKALAGIEGKLAFVEFYAEWCSPCKWMEKTTFSDPTVIKTLNENYISMKVNIDDFDGYAWKKEYNVSTLPTILIFNSSGRLVDRVEETMSAKELNGLLDVHNYDDNKVYKRHHLNKSPKDLRIRNANDKTKATPKKRRTYTADEKSSYKLHVGEYTEYEEALDYYQELNSQFVEPILVLNDIKNGKTQFKIYLGDFKTEDEAISFQKILKERFSIESVVK